MTRVSLERSFLKPSCEYSDVASIFASASGNTPLQVASLVRAGGDIGGGPGASLSFLVGLRACGLFKLRKIRLPRVAEENE
jgi:hypothetical protein